MKFHDTQIMFRNYCLIEKGMTAKNYRTIIRHMERMLEYLETDNINKVIDATIREYLTIESTNKCWTPKTYRNQLQSIRTFYRWCLIQKIVNKNPTDKIEKPRLPKRLPRCLSKSEVQKVFECAEQYDWLYKFARTRNLTILLTFLYTGMRLNELLHLRIIDISLDSQELYIHQAKGGKNRTVPIHPQLSTALRVYLEARRERGIESEWFFTGLHSDKRLYEKNITEICKKISIKSSIKFTPHMLRHTFAHLACDANLNLFKLKEILGHSNVSTTQIYLSVSKDGIKKSLGKITFL